MTGLNLTHTINGRVNITGNGYSLEIIVDKIIETTNNLSVKLIVEGLGYKQNIFLNGCGDSYRLPVPKGILITLRERNNLDSGQVRLNYQADPSYHILREKLLEKKNRAMPA